MYGSSTDLPALAAMALHGLELASALQLLLPLPHPAWSHAAGRWEGEGPWWLLLLCGQ
jgi:hypothetical protein